MAPAKPRARAGGGLWKRHFRSEPRSRLEQNIRTDRVRKQTRTEHQKRWSQEADENSKPEQGQKADKNIRTDRVRKQTRRTRTERVRKRIRTEH
jgi:hypothetical protein